MSDRDLEVPHPRLARFPGLPATAGAPALRVITTLRSVPSRTIGGAAAGAIPPGVVAPAAKSVSLGRVVDVITAGPYAGRVIDRHTGRIRTDPTTAYDLEGLT